VPAFLHVDDVHVAPEKVEPAVRRFLDRTTAKRHAALSAVVPEVFTFFAGLLRLDREFFDRSDPTRATLIHGALSRWEVLLRPGAPPLEPVLIDWERARLGRPAEDLASLVASLPSADRGQASEALLEGYADGLRASGVACETPTLEREMIRRHVLLLGRDLPQRCRLYVEREGDPDHREWCEQFVEQTARDVAEARRLLKQLAELDAV